MQNNYVDTKTISIILFWLLKAFSYCLFLVFGHVQYHVFNVFNWYFLHGLPREDSWNNNQVGEGKSWMVWYCILNIKLSKCILFHGKSSTFSKWNNFSLTYTVEFKMNRTATASFIYRLKQSNWEFWLRNVEI